MQWLVSPRYDLFFFIGSCLVTWVFLGIYHGLDHVGFAPRTESVLITYFIFTALFDHPHIFQTFSRSHADPAELARHRKTHTWGLAAFIAIGFALAAAKLIGYLIVFAAMFGSFHIMRQHWGILRAYKHLNHDRAPVDGWLDFATFYLGAAALYFYDYTGNPPETVIYGQLKAPFPNISPLFGEVALYLFYGVLVLFVLRQVWLFKTGRRINVPKLALLFAALSTHSLVFFFTATPFLVAEALETAYHNVQYQGWVMHYQRRRFKKAQVVKRWLLLAFAYGALVGCVEILALAEPRFAVLFIPFGMVVVWHYWADGKIWRMREQPELREAVIPRAGLGTSQP